MDAKIYTGHPDGGCVDIGEIKLTGYQFISDIDLAQLKSDNTLMKAAIQELSAKSELAAEICAENPESAHFCKSFKILQKVADNAIFCLKWNV